MIRIKVTTNFANEPFKRQTPNMSGIWGNCEFYINKDIEECDYWFVYRDLNKQEKVKCSLDKTYFITGEPESIKIFDKDFLNQFANIITSQKNIIHEKKILSQEGLPWLIGRKNRLDERNRSFMIYDDFKNKREYKKDKIISVITSNKYNTDGHKKRYDFVMKLKEAFGDNIDVFGRGINEIEDKWDAIASYKYHIVIENSIYDDYWTEKLADTFLAGAYPFYYGCSNISKYFDDSCYTKIDINKFDESLKIIEKIIKDETYEKSIESIREAKDLILDKYNFFAMVNQIVSIEKKEENDVQDITLKPELYFKKDIKSIIKRKILNRTK